MTEAFIFILGFLISFLLTHRGWKRHLVKKSKNNTGIVIDKEIYYLIKLNDYYQLLLKANCNTK